MQDSTPSPDQPEAKAFHAILKFREEIERHWEGAVRRKLNIAAGFNETPVFLAAYSFLDRLVEAVKAAAECHYEREEISLPWKQGAAGVKPFRLNIAELALEIQLLRHSVFHILKEKAHLSEGDREHIDRFFDEAASDVIGAFEEDEQVFRKKNLARLVHDMKGPLAVIVSAVDLLKRDPGNFHGNELHLKIGANAQKLGALINSILDEAQAEHAPIPLKLLKTDLHDLIVRSIEARIEKPIFEGCSVVGWWNPPDLSRALDNLLDNAFKYRKPFSPVTITVSCSGSRVHISVHNTGDPIPQWEQQDIFKEFYRADLAKDGHAEGSGLGLFIVKVLVRAHGGGVDVQSSAERGTTITIQLPIDSRPYVSGAERGRGTFIH